LLAHASGEWISSDWPVCPIGETATPHRMGAALTYARRYALFALVGIAGEDDLDAPSLAVEPPPGVEVTIAPAPTTRKPRNGTVHQPPQRKPILGFEASATLRDLLVAEIHELADADDLALWAHRQLVAKNTLSAEDAHAVELAYQSRLDATNRQPDQILDPAPLPESNNPENGAGGRHIPRIEHLSSGSMVTPLRKEVRRRNKVHLAFVAAQPCLVCQRSPSDAHHLKFAQPRTLGRKVSDEFTVPLCRDHHRDLHRYGNEQAWWANVSIEPLEAAKDLWDALGGKPTKSGEVTSVPNQTPSVS
jgi:hypothetical protein